MDLRQQFEQYEETGSLSYESGLGYTMVGNPVDVVCNELSYDNAVATFESANDDLVQANAIMDIVIAVEKYADTAKHSVDNGVATFETAVALSANIEKELAKGNLDVAYFIDDEAPTFESASNQPLATVSRLTDVFGSDDESYTVEAGNLDKFKESAKKKWAKFKQMVKELLAKAWATIKDAAQWVANLFRNNNSIASNLIDEAKKLDASKMVKDFKLKGGDFISTFPYLKEHNKDNLKKLVDMWSESGLGLSAMVTTASMGLVENGPELSETAPLPDNIMQSLPNIPGMKEVDANKGFLLNGVGKNVKVLTIGKEKKINTLIIKDLKGTLVNKDKAIAPLAPNDIISILEIVKTNNKKVETTISKLGKNLDSLKSAVVKDSEAMKVVTTMVNAITLYSKSSGSMSSAVIKTVGRHMKAYQKAE